MHDSVLLTLRLFFAGVPAECVCRGVSLPQLQKGYDGNGSSLQPAGGGQLYDLLQGLLFLAETVRPCGVTPPASPGEERFEKQPLLGLWSLWALSL